ncbi:MAG: hypothetical protein JJT78_03515 [Leptospira sp.]|nr:hypothetical protein [Leptospira sp.]
MNLIFISVFTILGLLISLTAGFMVGNRVTYIVFISMISSLSFAILGFGIHKVLEMKVPEFLSYLAELAGIMHESRSHDEMDEMGEGSRFGENANIDGEMDGASDSMGEMGPSFQTGDAKKSGKFGDHIMVDKIPIKNEPKLMAEAIRTMMSKDDEN